MSTRETLLKAAEVIEERGRCRRVFIAAPAGPVCAMGALAVACDIDPLDLYLIDASQIVIALWREDGPVYHAPVPECMTAAAAALVRSRNVEDLGDIAVWNDDPRTTDADVIRAFREAAEAVPPDA